MANKPKYSNEQIESALRQANGMKTIAAKILGCDYKTIANRIKKNQHMRSVVNELEENLGDNIESTLLRMALGVLNDDKKTYKEEPNITALIFLSKTHKVMRQRGYAERVEHTGENGGAIIIKTGMDMKDL